MTPLNGCKSLKSGAAVTDGGTSESDGTPDELPPDPVEEEDLAGGSNFLHQEPYREI